MHSMVDVITNSSTTIYTYQNGCEAPAKELINEMLKLAGENEKTADDVFYMGVFLDDNYRYFDSYDLPEECPKITARYRDLNYKEEEDLRNQWLESIKLSIMKGDSYKPQWMEDCEESSDGYNPSNSLYLIAKEEKYEKFGKKIQSLINGVSADGGYDG